MKPLIKKSKTINSSTQVRRQMDAGNTSVSEKYKTRLLEPEEVFQKYFLKIFEKTCWKYSMSKRYKARLLEREEIFSKFCSPKKKAWRCNLPYKHLCSHWSKSIFLLHHVTAFEIHNRNKFHHHMIKVCLFLCFSDWFGVPAVSSWWRKWTGEASVKILMCFILMYFVFCILYFVLQ